ncbi:zinc ribbon domain-containing protein [Halalkaliarchaeum sp. AArc-GB]|uniref:double zinc ribbon domain-containing protein n=1 Tax=Halalkaliarchaeum sp. AArc-GB TaxID=3074078 RepID=UPI00286042D7|nr:zinc ribbon domain-containing protein [Halalkaliarchaeum sp. AArc-GB]MDR5673136.1 zinc ribbon domain-containing protein [Halalkaliarchaeum sp. AArc-GB]
MSKITFRADDDLVERLEAYDASKSEVMREALRTFLDASDSNETGDGTRTGTVSSKSSPGSSTAGDGLEEDGIDGLIAQRVDELVSERLDARFGSYTPPSSPEVTVNVSLEGATAEGVDSTATHETESDANEDVRKTEVENADDEAKTQRKTCAQCGEDVPEEHVYCPNCGEKSSRRVFCDCGDELRSDWSFCPSCGRRTPAADVLDPR